jgi:WD40 repeat protein
MLSAYLSIFSLLCIASGCMINENESQFTPLPEKNTYTNPDPLSTDIYSPDFPFITPSPTAFITIPPQLTPHTPPQITAEHPLGRNMVAIMEWGNAKVFLMDLDTGYVRSLELPLGYRPFSVIAWTQNGCQMILKASGQAHLPGPILLVDLQGNIVQELLSFEQDILVANISFSPSQQWVAYLLSGGEYHGYIAPFHDYGSIEVIAVGGQVSPYRITQGIGVWDFAWAPDSTRLAFGDFDHQGIPQLYLYQLEGNERLQLTRFAEAQVNIHSIAWSPDGQRIAFAYEPVETEPPYGTHNTDLIIISLETGIVSSVLDDQLFLVDQLWWQDATTLVVMGYPGGYSPPLLDTQSERLFWVDVGTGQITDTLVSKNAPGGYIGGVRQMDSSSRLGYFTAGKFYTYDITLHSYQTWDNADVFTAISPNFIMRDWLPAPSSFQGEAACQP